MISERIPADAMRVAVLTPQALRQRRMATMKIRYFTRLLMSFMAVTTSLLPVAKYSRTICTTKLISHAQNMITMVLMTAGM